MSRSSLSSGNVHLSELITTVSNTISGLASLESIHGGRNELLIMNNKEQQSLDDPWRLPRESLSGPCNMVAMMLRLTG